MIRGITIQLINRIDTGTRDAANHPIYQDADPVAVNNVLVAPTVADDVISSTQLEGRKSVYTLGIPKGDTHIWENAKVILPEPFAGTYKVFGSVQAGIEEMVPLTWNKKVTVELYE